jgi:hypothetical protein
MPRVRKVSELLPRRVRTFAGKATSGLGRRWREWWEAVAERGRRLGVTRARRLFAVLLLLGWVAILMVSSLTSGLRTCDDEIARVGGTALVRSCVPLSFTAAPSLALLVVVGILLLPDLSVLEIPGVLRVERKLEEQARRQDDIAEMVHRLEVSQRVSQHVEVRTYNEVSASAAKVGELAALQDEKREQFDSDAS